MNAIREALMWLRCSDRCLDNEDMQADYAAAMAEVEALEGRGKPAAQAELEQLLFDSDDVSWGSAEALTRARALIERLGTAPLSGPVSRDVATIQEALDALGSPANSVDEVALRGAGTVALDRLAALADKHDGEEEMR